MTESATDSLLVPAMQAVAQLGWHGLTMAKLSAASGLHLTDLQAAFPTRHHLLWAVSAAADRAVLREPVFAEVTESPRDRLFDVMMRRFDALKPYRPGLQALWRDGRRDPALGLALSHRVAASMAWMLEAAGLDPTGPRGLLRVIGLTAIHAAVFRVWIRDEGADHGATMAELDRRLKSAEIWGNRLQASARTDATSGDAPSAPGSDVGRT